ncbi:MAG: aminotransferase class I/II-fold pyridoxal phosphate-dependent enzyme, partial [Planctomycetes bacterium]|nr:aminotransferase class I/II-fold pyridoxal phosphate-dependent enzyme [Planctomycetota bacterium]
MNARLAVDGGAKAKNTPYGEGRRFTADDEQAAVAAVRSQHLWYIGGTRVLAAEAAIRRLIGASHAVCCSSGTAAVHTALAACGVEPGDEVIVNPITDWGSIAGILALGAVPVFCDIELATYSLDPEALARAITSRTSAILVVHLGGYPARIREIAGIARASGVALIEDCAQSPLASVDGAMVGTFGDAGAFSTNDSKHISCGEGGVVVARDAEVARVARLFTDKGYDRSAQRGGQAVGFLAFNYRMSELSAAVLG